MTTVGLEEVLGAVDEGCETGPWVVNVIALAAGGGVGLPPLTAPPDDELVEASVLIVMVPVDDTVVELIDEDEDVDGMSSVKRRRLALPGDGELNLSWADVGD